MKIVSLLISILTILTTKEAAKINRYNYSNYDEKTKYTPIEFNRSLYNSSAPCVTVFDLIAFHYTANLADIAPTGNVFPENFCYGMINYNITREDFRDIIQKNVNAFKNYRTLIPFYIFTNYTGKDLLDDGCIGYMKLMACLSEFPACQDNLDGRFTVHPICSSICTTYKRRCTNYYFPQFCKKKSKNNYCPSTQSDKCMFIEINLWMVMVFVYFLF